MPARRASLAITDRYRQQFTRANVATSKKVGKAFNDLVRVDDLDGGFERFAVYATAEIDRVRAAQVELADTYLAAYTSSELRRKVEPTGIDPNRFTGLDRFARPLDVALRPPVFTVKLALLQGYAVPAAVAFGVARVSRITGAEVAAAGRTVLSELMRASGNVVGWRRVAAGEACGACLGAATGAIRADDEVPDVHDNCQCTAEPVIGGVSDNFERPSGQDIFDSKSEAEQNALFSGRGGAEKADLIREGMPISDLIERTDLALGGSSITEAPLSKLTA